LRSTQATLTINAPCGRRAIEPIRLPSPRQFTPDRAGRTAQKRPNGTLAAASMMFSEYHATFLTIEVLVLSFHNNILCPLGWGVAFET
jgi:hypothetical protein